MSDHGSCDHEHLDDEGKQTKADLYSRYAFTELASAWQRFQARVAREMGELQRMADGSGISQDPQDPGAHMRLECVALALAAWNSVLTNDVECGKQILTLVMAGFPWHRAVEVVAGRHIGQDELTASTREIYRAAQEMELAGQDPDGEPQ